MINLEDIRARCDELLKKAIDEDDKVRIESLRICKECFAEEDCFSDEKKHKNWLQVVFKLDLSRKEIHEFEDYLNSRTKVNGLLYIIGSDGKEYPKEVILDPKYERYYQFLPGPVCKKRFPYGGICETYVLFDGHWVHDGSLQRKFIDPGYDYEPLRYKILNNE